MAAGDRTKRIRDRAQLVIGVAVPGIETVILPFIDDAQGLVAEEGLCLEGSSSVTVTAGVATEPAAFYKLKLISLGSGTSYQPSEISVEEYDAMTRILPTSITGKGRFFKRWGGTLTFYPVLDTASYTFYYWKIPTTNVSVTVDPETPARFDNAVEYSAIAECARLFKPDIVPQYLALFQQELDRAKKSWRRTKPGHFSIPFSDMG